MGHSQSFEVIKPLGKFFEVQTALFNQKVMELANLATLATFPDKSEAIMICNNFFYNTDPKQYKALLPPMQANAHGICLDLTANRHYDLDGNPGRHMMQVLMTRYHLFFDGYKCYLPLWKPSKSDWENYPQLELTAPLPYQPARCLHSARVQGLMNKWSLADWRACRG